MQAQYCAFSKCIDGKMELKVTAMLQIIVEVIGGFCYWAHGLREGGAGDPYFTISKWPKIFWSKKQPCSKSLRKFQI